MPPRTSIDQWRALAAVVDQGGFAAAARHLHRSQSAVSYAITQLQQSLGTRVLQIVGRKARLTPVGEQLLRRSRSIVDQLVRLEALAHAIETGWEGELTLVVDASFPQPALLEVLRELRERCGHTTIRLEDAVLSGAEDAITSGSGDVVVTTRVPAGFAGDWLLDVGMIAVAAPAHPLHALQRPLTLDDLALHTQVVLRDSGQAHRDEGWLGAGHRWTVGALEASRAAVGAGLAYAWLPEHLVAGDLAAGRLRPLPLTVGGRRKMQLYVVLARGEAAGPAARTAVALFQQHAGAGQVGGPAVAGLPVQSTGE